MNLYNSPLWFQDIDKVISFFPKLDFFENKKIMITGAAGLICSAITDILIRYNETHSNNIEIYAAGRWFEEMENRFFDYTKKSYFHFVKYDASKKNKININVDYIIHGASNAFPSAIVSQPVETMLSNFNGLYELLELAKTNKTKRVLYISSSEVYGEKESNEPYKEGEYGYIDLLNSRNSYSVGKRAAETLCASYSDEYGIETVIVRPGHIYGPTASSNDNRVASAFAYLAAKGENIIMKSDGLQLRSYCYCLDCAFAILTVLLKGKNKEAYNISNPDSIISIKEMAELLAKYGKVKLIQTQANKEEKKGFNPMSNSSLDSKNLESLGWKSLFSAAEGLKHTLIILRGCLNNGQ